VDVCAINTEAILAIGGVGVLTAPITLAGTLCPAATGSAVASVALDTRRLRATAVDRVSRSPTFRLTRVAVDAAASGESDLTLGALDIRVPVDGCFAAGAGRGCTGRRSGALAVEPAGSVEPVSAEAVAHPIQIEVPTPRAIAKPPTRPIPRAVLMAPLPCIAFGV
jgi:hypothetical protein